MLPSRRNRLAVALGLAAAVTGGVSLADAIAGGASASADIDHPEWYTYDVLSVVEADEQLTDAIAAAEAATQRLADHQTEALRLHTEQADLQGQQAVLFDALRQAAVLVRSLAVDAFVAGGNATEIEMVLGAGGPDDASWRVELVREQSRTTADALAEFQRLQQAAGARLVQLSNEIDRAAADILAAEFDVFLAGIALTEARTELVIAQAWDRAEQAIAGGRFGGLPDAEWLELRHCESTDNYAAVDPTGSFFGAYQFTFDTWASVGGHGNPAEATPEEQDARARILYAERGRSPWPVCGRRLPVSGS